MLGIRRMLNPIARTAAFFLDTGGISARGAAFFAFICAAGTFGAFALLDPFRDFDVLSIAVPVLIFLSALLGDAEMELRRMQEAKALRPLSRGLLGLTEPLVLLGVLYFIYRKPDILVGEAAITLAPMVSPLFGALLLAGLLLSSYVRSVERKVGIVEGFPLEERATRLYFLAFVCAVGIPLGDDLYPGVLLAGIATVTFTMYTMVYVKLFERGFPAVAEEVPYEERIETSFSFSGMFKGVLGIPGRVLRTLAEREEERKLGPEEVEVPRKKPMPAKRPQDEMMRYLFNVLVTGEDGETPVKKAEVSLEQRELKKRYGAKTDDSGKVSFEGIVEGDYDITVKAKGYEPLSYERPIYGDSGESFVLTEVSHTFTVEVSDRETFAPIEGAKAILQVEEEGEPVAIETTDDSGTARFEEVEEKGYLLSIEAARYGTETAKIDPTRKNEITILLSTKKRPKKKEKKVEEEKEEKEEAGATPDIITIITEQGGENGISFEELLDSTGLGKAELDKALEELMGEGEVYEVEEGIYRRV